MGVHRGPETYGLPNYWIEGFLASSLEASSEQGSKRLAQAFRDAIRTAVGGEAKGDLLTAARMVRGLGGQRLSPSSIVTRFALRPAAAEALRAALPRRDLFEQEFELNMAEFDRWAAFRSIELDNGAVLMGPDAKFEEIFHPEEIAPSANVVGPIAARFRYTTEGQVVSQELRKST